MPTPKPGQIRCPTCHRPTPMAAFCTQCGAAIPPGAQARPRGMDRQELDARIRQRRPGDPRLRRGTPFDGGDGPAAGYVPFQPDPEDARAVRDAAGQEQPRVDNTAPDFDERAAQAARPQPPAPPEAVVYSEPEYRPEAAAEQARDQEPEPPYVSPGPPPASQWDEPDEPYGAPEDAYPYAWEPEEEPGRGGAGMLPIIGFAVLAILALGVGAALAGLITGGAADASATPTPSLAATSSAAPSDTASPTEGGATATPQPTDGPVTFADGAELSIQPCGSSGYRADAVGRPREDACEVDGSSISGGNVWAFVNFAGAAGSDTLTVKLLQHGQAQDEQKFTISSKLEDCDPSCPGGLLFGAQYSGLLSGDYKLILERNGEFADSATFTVE